MKEAFNKIIKEICEENFIKCTFLSDGWIIMLEKNNIARFIYGYTFNLNYQASGMIVEDKSGLYEVLKTKNIPTIEHNLVYNPNNKYDYAQGNNTYEYVKQYFLNNNNHIVIKPNKGTCGNYVYEVTNINKIDEVLNKVFKINTSISICPFYKIKNEYRTIMLNEEPKILYKKIRPIVIGDGIKTIKQLLLEFNNPYFKNKLESREYNRVLSKGEEYHYDWRFNLSKGAIAKKVDDTVLEKKIIKIAKSVCKVLNIKLASVDIIETTNNELLVMETNSGVMTENYLKLYPEEYKNIKEIYKEAVECLFKISQ